MTRKSQTESKKRAPKNAAPKKQAKRRNPSRKKGKIAAWKHRWGVSDRFIVGFVTVIALALFGFGMIGANLLHKHFAVGPASDQSPASLITRQTMQTSSGRASSTRAAVSSRPGENAIQRRVSAQNTPHKDERGIERATQGPLQPVPLANRGTTQGSHNQTSQPWPESREKRSESMPLSTSAATELLFEEQSTNRLEDAVKRVDRLLLDGLDAQAVPYSVSMNKVEWREHSGDMYHFQRLVILFQGNSKQKFHAIAALRRILDEKFKGAQPATSLVELTESRWYVSIGGIATHELLFSAGQAQPPQPDHTIAPPKPVIQPGRTARLVILIDDIGASKTMLREFLGLDIPMAFAVLPHSAYARESAAMITRAGHELLLHHPMEPERFPAVKPGPGAVYAKDNEARIAAVLADNLARVPGIQGLNNHMGSKFTGNAQAVELFLRALSGKGLFVVDSLTSPRSKLYQTAQGMGIKAYRRDVFLDDVSDRGSIRHELDKAARLAQSQGQALAIGHPRPETLAVLKEWLKSGGGKGVVFSRLKDIQ